MQLDVVESCLAGDEGLLTKFKEQVKNLQEKNLVSVSSFFYYLETVLFLHQKTELLFYWSSSSLNFQLSTYCLSGIRLNNEAEKTLIWNIFDRFSRMRRNWASAEGRTWCWASCRNTRLITCHASWRKRLVSGAMRGKPSSTRSWSWGGKWRGRGWSTRGGWRWKKKLIRWPSSNSDFTTWKEFVDWFYFFESL